jgi:hypothetical protein
MSVELPVFDTTNSAHPRHERVHLPEPSPALTIAIAGPKRSSMNLLSPVSFRWSSGSRRGHLPCPCHHKIDDPRDASRDSSFLRSEEDRPARARGQSPRENRLWLKVSVTCSMVCLYSPCCSIPRMSTLFLPVPVVGTCFCPGPRLLPRAPTPFFALSVEAPC